MVRVGMLTLQELSLKQDLASVEQAVNIQFLGDWEEQVREYLLDLQVGVASLNDVPQSSNDEQEIFEIKRQVVTTLVRRITIDRNRELHVEIGLNLLKILDYDTPNGFEGKDKAQIKTAGIHLRNLDLTAPVDLLNLGDDISKRFEGQNQDQIKTTGIYPGWRDDS
jgi:hypothetical protein